MAYSAIINIRNAKAILQYPKAWKPIERIDFMLNYIKEKEKKQLKEKYRVIYTPAGAAREYSELALNTATGCEHGCKYCYVPSIRRMSRDAYQKEITHRKGLLNKLILDLKEMKEVGDKRRVMLCFMTDPYQPALAKSTRRYLEEFRKYDIAFQVLTKNGALAKEDFDLYSDKDAYASTIVFSKESTRQLIEPSAGTIKERIDSLKKAKEKGIETWVSLEPVIYPKEALEVIELTKEYTDHYKVGKVNYFKLKIEPDWEKFTHEVIEKLEKENKSYYIKKSLQPYL